MNVRKSTGLTLVELLISLVISAILIGGLYRVFIRQQSVHIGQERVVDMQQNARIGINRMMREIRMTAFGNMTTVLPLNTTNGRTFQNPVNPNYPNAGDLSIVLANVVVGTLTTQATVGQNIITVTPIPDSGGNPQFDLADRAFVSIGGLESHRINVDGDAGGGNRLLSLNGTLGFTHPAGSPVFGIRAITYRIDTGAGRPILIRDDQTVAEPLADNIEDLQFQFLDGAGGAPATPAAIRLVNVTLMARTEIEDPDSNEHLKRQLQSNIHLKNMGLAAP